MTLDCQKPLQMNQVRSKFKVLANTVLQNRFTGKVGRKGNVFSLGLIFVEPSLLFFGQNGLKYHIKSGFFMDILARESIAALIV